MEGTAAELVHELPEVSETPGSFLFLCIDLLDGLSDGGLACIDLLQRNRDGRGAVVHGPLMRSIYGIYGELMVISSWPFHG